MGWRAVCRASELGEGQAIEVVIDSNVIALFRSGGQLYAIDGICAHQGGPIARGRVEHDCVTCPWHGWQYHLRNGHNAVTNKPMLRSYPIQQTADQIEIQID